MGMSAWLVGSSSSSSCIPHWCIERIGIVQGIISITSTSLVVVVVVVVVACGGSSLTFQNKLNR